MSRQLIEEPHTFTARKGLPGSRGELQIRPLRAYVVLVSSWYISSILSGG